MDGKVWRLKKITLFDINYITYILVKEKEGKPEHTIKSIIMFLKFVRSLLL